MSSCRDMDRLIQLYVDQEIDKADLARLREHVDHCGSCRQSLQEMIALVHSLEEIRRHEHSRRPATVFNHMVKWAAVYTAIAFMVYFVPQLQQHQSGSMNGQTAEQVPVAGPEQSVSRSTVMVLATSSEKLHIPENDYVQVIRPRHMEGDLNYETAMVYPSAIPTLMKDRQGWVKRIKRFVFIRVPDGDTMEELLHSAGFSRDQYRDHDFTEDTFPISVILTTGDQPQVETFTFPDNEQNISQWFDNLAAPSTLQ
ncbi:zf-HC2 domain-containing protein [Paludifilum halophilum]|uniref:Anti-sigma-W factor RsiW n=1 Tax=Paludifilum halophilum TaxID=1642702 RepID=A0A235BBR8_9BACL|nr:zf-HC2 domain-containing protein [Paludifilum halophilum]OYD09005.1 hypothetical protein CHM34_04315 [Paludifilum halophilum]